MCGTAPAHVKCEVEGRRLINFIVSDGFNNAWHYTPHKLHMAFVRGYEESAREGRVSNLYCKIAVEKPQCRYRIAFLPNNDASAGAEEPSCAIKMLAQAPKKTLLHDNMLQV